MGYCDLFATIGLLSCRSFRITPFRSDPRRFPGDAASAEGASRRLGRHVGLNSERHIGMTNCIPFRMELQAVLEGSSLHHHSFLDIEKVSRGFLLPTTSSYELSPGIIWHVKEALIQIY